MVLALELERLDALTLAAWPRARAGDDRAIRVVLRIMQRRAKLLGLDAPLKSATTSQRQDVPVHEAGWSPAFCTEVLELLALYGQDLRTNGTTPGQEERC